MSIKLVNPSSFSKIYQAFYSPAYCVAVKKLNNKKDGLTKFVMKLKYQIELTYRKLEEKYIASALYFLACSLLR